MLTATLAFPQIREKYLLFFSKGGYTQPVKERAAREGALLLGVEDLYS